MKNKILLFIPIFNCEIQIKRLLRKLERNDLELIQEILIIDNRSTDNSILELKKNLIKMKFNIRLKLIQNDFNYHLGGSHKIALNYALENDFEGLIIMHGDDQTDLSYLTNVLKEKKNYLGARFIDESNLPGYNIVRILGNKVFNFLFSIIIKKKVYDIGCGLNYFQLENFKDKEYLNFPDEILYPVYINMFILKNNKSYEWFPLNWEERDQKSNARLFFDTAKLCILLFKVLFNIKFNYDNKKKYTYKLIYEKK